MKMSNMHGCHQNNWGAHGKVIFCHHLASVFRRLSSANISHYNLLLRNCLNRNLVVSIYGRFSINIAHFVHLAKRFPRRRFFRNRPMRNKNCRWWPYLLMNRDEMSNIYRGPSIDALIFRNRNPNCECRWL
jgi:hypothetical protein